MATNKSLPFKVTSDADCTITETADGYSVEVAGNTVIETTSGGTITLSLPKSADATTAPTAILNFDKAGQLLGIIDGTTGGDANTGLSSTGATLDLSGLQPSDIAGDTLIIGDISIDIPDVGDVNYNQKVTLDAEGNIAISITTNVAIETNVDEDPLAEENPYVFTRGEGVSESVVPTYYRDSDGSIYGINLPVNTSVTGPFDGITELNGKAFDIAPKTAGTIYTLANDGGTLSFTGLKDGDSVIKAAGITTFITSGDGTITFGGTACKFTDVGNNGGIFLVENNKVTGFVFRDAGDALTVQKGQSQPKLYDNFPNIQEANLPFIVTSTSADYTIAKTADGYSIEVGEGDSVIEKPSTDTKIEVTVPPASDSTTATVTFNFDEAGQLISIHNPTVGDANPGPSPGINLSGFTGIDIAGHSLQIGDILIDIPELITGTEKADKIKETLDGATIQTFGGKDIIRSYGDTVSIDAGEGNDSIRNYGDDVTISGGTGNDTIRNNGDTASIDGGAGNDVIRNYGDAVTLTGGTGNDVIRNYGEEVMIQYANGDGNDSIVGFDETSTLNIAGTYSTTKSGKNIIVTVGKGKITLSGAASLETLNVFRTTTLTDKNTSKVTLSADVIGVDASARTKAIRLVGNALDNTIFGGSGKDTIYGKDGDDYIEGGAGNDKLYGQNGDDTLIGGAGNDSLWGADGSDTFIYAAGDGKDVIVGFDDTDMLEISGDWTATYNKTSKAVAFKVGDTSNAITLKSFTATTFNINGDTYKISGTKLVKQ